MVGLWRNLKGKISRNKLTVFGFSLLTLLTVVLVVSVVYLSKSSLNRFSNNRAELIERDLKDLIGQFDADERYVLERNLDVFLKRDRPFTPLLLPRQYYSSLPSGSSNFIPRQPPRNCFLRLLPLHETGIKNEKFPEKFCSYFVEPQNVGKYLFLSFSINENEVVPLRRGDSTLAADTIKITVTNAHNSGTWWIYFQPSLKVTSANRFQITAFRETSNGTLELDRRMEGWAYVQQQADSLKVVNILARLNFVAFISDGEETWPPMGWKDTNIKLTRSDRALNGAKSYEYSSSGESYLSIPSISTNIFNTYANLELILPNRKITIQETEYGGKSPDEHQWFNDNYDLFINHKPAIERSRLLQDTDITFKITQSSVILERSLWGSLLFMTLVSFFYIPAAAYLLIKVMRPVFVLARQARQMMNNELSALPYADEKNEIGDLSSAFNDLLKEREEQALKRATLEREARIKYEEEMKSRETTLQFIGHEIRSPLQSLKDLTNKDTPAARYIARMTQAINTLEDISGPDSLFSKRKMNMGPLNLKIYLDSLAQNCDSAQFPNVVFEGPVANIVVITDDSVLEDAITNILNNAHRHRNNNTSIVIKLHADGGFAVIDIVNEGPHIPEDCQESIFELGYSSRPNDSNLKKGIGLYAVRQYITRLGGTVTAQNIILGVCFTIRIPIMKINDIN